MSQKLRLIHPAMQEVKEACHLLVARFPTLAKAANDARVLAEQGNPLARDYYNIALKNVSDLSDFDDRERAILGRAANWLSGQKYFPLTPEPEPEPPGTLNGSFIRKWRDENNLTQAQLAEKLDISKSTIENWEQGRYKAPVFLMRALNDVARELSKTA